jgi:hypothetical protein
LMGNGPCSLIGLPVSQGVYGLTRSTGTAWGYGAPAGPGGFAPRATL